MKKTMKKTIKQNFKNYMKLSFIFLISVIAFISEGKENTINFLPSIFPTVPKEKQCQFIPAKKSTDDPSKLRSSYQWLDPQIGQMIESIKVGIQTADPDKLRSLFHPRLKTTSAAIQEVLKKQEKLIGKPFNTQIEKVWGLFTLDGTSSKITCQEDAIQISPLYGYDYQVALWVNSTGPSETAKIFITLVVLDSKWYIGNFHWQQWTHQGKDSINWVADADKLMTTQNYLASWTYYDLAKKLINGKSYFEIDLEKKISDHQNKFAPDNTWQKQVATFFPNEKVSYLASLLTTDGAGLLVRFSIEKEISASQIRDNCKIYLQNLLKQKWFDPMSGLRCSYILPHEAPEKEGRLGGLYVSRSDIKKIN